MSQEQRRSRRRHLFYYLPVHRQDNGALVGRLTDLTEDGFMLLCDEALPSGTRLGLQIRPESDLSHIAAIDVEADCRWCRAEDGGGFAAGFAFHDQRLATARAINTVLDEIGMRD